MPIDLPQSEPRPPAGTFDLPVAGETHDAVAPPPPPATGHKHHSPAVRHHRPWIIGLAVLSAAIVGVLAVIVLYHRNSPREEAYTNIIYVWAMDESWDGAKVTVTGENLRFVDEITEKNHLSCRIHVPAGNFKVAVEKDGHTIARVESSRPLMENTTWWPFRAPPSATRPVLQ